MENKLSEYKFTDFDYLCMKAALEEAELAFSDGEVPVGACIVHNGHIIAKAHNTRERDKNAIRHAEINVIDRACQLLESWRLSDCTLYVTLEPCPMCAGAIINSRIKSVIYAAKDSSYGALGSVLNILSYPVYKPSIKYGLLEKEAIKLLKDFFSTIRSENN